MPLELTTMSLSSQVSVNNTLRRTFTSNIPILDGFIPNGQRFSFNEALEGPAVPNASSAVYTKSYVITTPGVPAAYLLFCSNSTITTKTTITQDLELRSTYFGDLTSTQLAQDGNSPNNVDIFDNTSIAIYTTTSHTSARRLYIAQDNGRDINLSGVAYPSITFLKTYTQLGNSLFGYYGGLGNHGIVQRLAKSGLQATWVNPNYINATTKVVSGTRFTSVSSISGQRTIVTTTSSISAGQTIVTTVSSLSGGITLYTTTSSITASSTVTYTPCTLLTLVFKKFDTTSGVNFNNDKFVVFW